VQSPGRNQRIVVKECAERDVNQDVNSPDRGVGNDYFGMNIADSSNLLGLKEP